MIGASLSPEPVVGYLPPGARMASGGNAHVEEAGPTVQWFNPQSQSATSEPGFPPRSQKMCTVLEHLFTLLEWH